MKWPYSFLKYLIFFSLPCFILAADHAAPTAAQENSLIGIDRNSLNYEDEVTVTFKNVLDRKITVITSGCGLEDGGYLPKLIIVKQKNEEWEKAGEPICIAIASPHIYLKPGESKSITFSVRTGLEDPKATGRFRYVFDIRTEIDGEDPRGSKVSKDLRTSPPFVIQNKNGSE